MSLEEPQSRHAAQSPTNTTTKPTDATRTQRARLEWLDRILSRCGFVRTHNLRLTADNELSGHLKAPKRLLHQSIAPPLQARDLGYTVLSEPSEPRGTDDVVTARIYEKP